MVRVFYATGTEAWLPTRAELALLGRLVTEPAQVEIHPRAELARVWARTHGAGLPVAPCALRAWADKTGRRAYLFVDAAETRESVLWLIGHELGHLELRQAPLVELGVYAPRGADYLATDEGHEADPEEQLCNQVGAAVVELLTGQRRMLDRRWWRRRSRRLGCDRNELRST